MEDMNEHLSSSEAGIEGENIKPSNEQLDDKNPSSGNMMIAENEDKKSIIKVKPADECVVKVNMEGWKGKEDKKKKDDNSFVDSDVSSSCDSNESSTDDTDGDFFAVSESLKAMPKKTTDLKKHHPVFLARNRPLALLYPQVMKQTRLKRKMIMDEDNSHLAYAKGFKARALNLQPVRSNALSEPDRASDTDTTASSKNSGPTETKILDKIDFPGNELHPGHALKVSNLDALEEKMKVKLIDLQRDLAEQKMRQETLTGRECQACGEIFATFPAYTKHIQDCPLLCQCGTAFNKQASFLYHIQSCEVAKKNASKKSSCE